MARVEDRLVKIVRDSLVTRDILYIKRELSKVQRLLSSGRIEDARDNIEKIGIIMGYITKEINDEDILADIRLAD